MAEREVEFGVEIGEYRGVVTIPRRVFQRLLPERPTPEKCVEAPPAAPLRKHRRTKAAATPVDRGGECGDRRAASPL